MTSDAQHTRPTVHRPALKLKNLSLNKLFAEDIRSTDYRVRTACRASGTAALISLQSQGLQSFEFSRLSGDNSPASGILWHSSTSSSHLRSMPFVKVLETNSHNHNRLSRPDVLPGNRIAQCSQSGSYCVFEEIMMKDARTFLPHLQERIMLKDDTGLHCFQDICWRLLQHGMSTMGNYVWFPNRLQFRG